jgi:hypothetical protein
MVCPLISIENAGGRNSHIISFALLNTVTYSTKADTNGKKNATIV